MKTWTDEAKAYADHYLRQVQVLLEGGGADAREVVEDLQRHIHEQAQNSPQVVITIDDAKRVVAGIGSPEEVAFAWKQMGTDTEKNTWGETHTIPLPPEPISYTILKVLLYFAGVVLYFGITIFLVSASLKWFQAQSRPVPGVETVTTEYAPIKIGNSLHTAASGGHLEEVTNLLLAGASPNARDVNGMTPLHLAAKNGHSGTARTLVEHGADTTIRDIAGKTPADYAAAGGHDETLAAINGESVPHPASDLQPGMYTKESIASRDAVYFFQRIGNPEPGYHDFAGMWAVILKANAADQTTRDAIIADALNIAADTSRSFAQRYQCVYVASQFGDPRTVPNLAQLLYYDADPKLRGVVACALGQIGGPQAREALRSAQQNETDPENQSWISRALAGEFKRPALPQYGSGPN